MSEERQAILLAIGGGVAAYKSAVVCSRLVQAGYRVKVMMTRSAEQFVGQATFSALSGNPVAVSTFDPSQSPLGPHIEMTVDVSLMLVAPATANLIGKFALGLADDLVSTSFLQCRCPVLLAPAMSDVMWSKSAVQRNIETLRDDGCHLVGPESGWLSCRQTGEGRMSDPEEIVEKAKFILGSKEV